MYGISVIVPVYKVEKYIHRCVDSILRQTFRDFELILVDDGSPDNCGAICDEYAAKDSRVHVIHQENGGLSAARNAGIDWVFVNSDSQWITFVDSDDWIHPQMLMLLYNSAVDNGVNVSMCGFAVTSGETPELQQKEFKVKLYAPDEYLTSVAWGKLYHVSCFTSIRYPVGKLHEDEFTTYRILFCQKSFAVTEVPMYFYYQNADGIMRSVWTSRRLDAVEAKQEQITYFVQNGFERAYKLTVVEYIAIILQNIDSVQNSALVDAEKNKYTRYLRCCLRKALWKHKDVLWNQERWVYLEAYPELAKVLRKVKRWLMAHKKG